ncbi:MAG: glycerol-3-phosphate 1-O-acyltransferase PlsY [Candidatus Methylomirabilia bacterium]
MSPMVLVWVLVAYLSGSVPFGVIAARFFGGLDVRRHGSGNIGTANVLRTAGKGAAIVTLAGDLLKGYLPAFLAGLLALPPLEMAAVGLGAIVGHNWSCFLRFSGGKGVATSFGVFLALAPLPALGSLVAWIGVLGCFRYTSLAALAASLAVPPLILLERGVGTFFWLSALAALLIFVRHRDNIRRLQQGTEPRVGEQST